MDTVQLNRMSSDLLETVRGQVDKADSMRTSPHEPNPHTNSNSPTHDRLVDDVMQTQVSSFGSMLARMLRTQAWMCALVNNLLPASLFACLCTTSIFASLAHALQCTAFAATLRT